MKTTGAQPLRSPDFLQEDFPQHVSVPILVAFVRETHHSNCLIRGEVFEEAEGEFLIMVLDGCVVIIQSRALKQFVLIASRKLYLTISSSL